MTQLTEKLNVTVMCNCAAKRYHVRAQRKHNKPAASVYTRRSFPSHPGQRQLLRQAPAVLP